ncbi:hypothetical protein DXD09_05790 [Ligilactobacillus ruminis]|uniref:Uncharacterized protein n=1 Tax=Ligilactobacillus ruminis TaxID=1623 RepID=A0A8B2ZBT7_9LACO|nr:hypothetical protein DXD09_05790 [Ligilactobacillus ruminis]
MPEIKALDDLRLIPNLIRGFCACRIILCYDRKLFPFIKTLKRNEGLTSLRAYLKNRHFARNRGLHFTGIFQKSTFCP